MDTEVLFCAKCHKFVTQYISDEQGIQLFRNGRPYGARWHGNRLVDGIPITGLPVYCPSGHSCVIEETQESIDEQERLKFNFGKVCTYHYRNGAVCDRRQECITCIVYENYNKKLVVV